VKASAGAGAFVFFGLLKNAGRVETDKVSRKDAKQAKASGFLCLLGVFA